MKKVLLISLYEDISSIGIRYLSSYLKNNGITEEYLIKVKEAQRRSLETSLKENGTWLSSLATRYRFNENPSGILRYGDFIDGLNADMIQNAAQKYFNINNYVKVSLFPETDEQ